jgi:transcriptional regulator with XRE-family HTH domain
VSGRAHDGRVNDIELGRRFRALRHRRGWRQADVGEAAGLSQDLVSLAECGHIAELSVRSLRALAGALDAELKMELWFRGGEVDRLLDEGHAALVDAVVGRLAALGWEVRPEVSFAVYGERGSIDVVAWHAESRTLLVVEVKTELTSVEATLRRHDVKVRLAAGVVRERFGWQPARVARLLVLPDGSTPRRQVARHDAAMRSAYPLRGRALRLWLAGPTGSVAGLAYMSFTNTDRAGQRPTSRRRVTVQRVGASSPNSRTASAVGDRAPPIHEPASSSATAGRPRLTDHERGS